MNLAQERRLLRLNFIDPSRLRTPTPPGWLPYDGSRYTAERGHGWLQDMRNNAIDRGPDRSILMPDGTVASTGGRPELSNWQGTHRENRLIVFRVDLSDGWYRVACASVDPGVDLPVIDVRSIKCRSHDAVFAGPRHGPPLRVPGRALVEGKSLVEVTERHLRIVVGDPAYAGWVSRHPGPWWRGWGKWFAREGDHRYAEDWLGKLTRVIDPGFHSLRLNSLVIEPASPPPDRAHPLFRDVFNRDDAAEVNAGVPVGRHWNDVEIPGTRRAELALEKTAMRLTGSRRRPAGLVVVQERPSPSEGVVRYSTSVSVFAGEGSRAGSGRQEAGLLMLADAQRLNDETSTFVGVVVGRQGGVAVRSGNPKGTGSSKASISAANLPFDLGAGEYEILVEHDVRRNLLTRIVVNGHDLTSRVPQEVRRPARNRGLFGIRAVMDPAGSGVPLAHFYWFYRIDQITAAAPPHSTRSVRAVLSPTRTGSGKERSG